MSVDEAKMRAEVSRNIFADRLRYFTDRWGPKGPRDLYDFQMDMTRLMVDAMRHKSDCLSYGVETYAAATFTELSLRPLCVIHEQKPANR